MNFAAKLKAAGFNKRTFSEHIGKHYVTVLRWKDDPPRLVLLYLAALVRIVGLVKQVVRLRLKLKGVKVCDSIVDDVADSVLRGFAHQDEVKHD